MLKKVEVGFLILTTLLIYIFWFWLLILTCGFISRSWSSTFTWKFFN